MSDDMTNSYMILYWICWL